MTEYTAERSGFPQREMPADLVGFQSISSVVWVRVVISLHTAFWHGVQSLKYRKYQPDGTQKFEIPRGLRSLAAPAVRPARDAGIGDPGSSNFFVPPGWFCDTFGRD